VLTGRAFPWPCPWPQYVQRLASAAAHVLLVSLRAEPGAEAGCQKSRFLELDSARVPSDHCMPPPWSGCCSGGCSDDRLWVRELGSGQLLRPSHGLSAISGRSLRRLFVLGRLPPLCLMAALLARHHQFVAGPGAPCAVSALGAVAARKRSWAAESIDADGNKARAGTAWSAPGVWGFGRSLGIGLLASWPDCPTRCPCSWVALVLAVLVQSSAPADHPVFYAGSLPAAMPQE